MKTKTRNLGLVFSALTVLMLASAPPVCAQTGTWTNGAAIPTASYGLGGAFVGGKFYAISGFATTRVGVYNPTNNSWSTAAPLPELLQYSGTAVLDGKIYVIGGDTGGFGDRATLYRYDPTLDSWTNLASMPLGSRYGLGAAALNGKIYAVGGYNLGTATFLDRVEEYNPTNNTWTTKASMPTAHFSALTGAINGKLYVAGGRDAIDATSPGTGVGQFVSSLVEGFANSSAVELYRYSVTARGWRSPEANTSQRWPMPARPLRELWRRTNAAPIEWWTGALDVVHGTNFVVPPSKRAVQLVSVHDMTTVRFPELCTADTLQYPASNS